VSRICHSEGQKVPPSDAEVAEDWVEFLEVVASRRSKKARSEIRPIISAQTGVPVSKLYSLARRGRMKDVSNDLLRRLGTALIRELRRELRLVEDDLKTRTQIGEGPDSSEIRSLVARHAKIREALGLTGTASGGSP
jgi:hypothetical protein